MHVSIVTAQHGPGPGHSQSHDISSACSGHAAASQCQSSGSAKQLPKFAINSKECLLVNEFASFQSYNFNVYTT